MPSTDPHHELSTLTDSLLSRTLTPSAADLEGWVTTVETEEVEDVVLFRLGRVVEWRVVGMEAGKVEFMAKVN